MSKKIFFSDLDGTLLTDKKEISPATYKAVIDWMDNGNYLALSSGRPLESIKQVIAEHKLMHTNLYAIGFNGSLIFHPESGKKLTNKTLNPDTMQKICKIAQDEGIFCQAYNDTSIIVPYESEALKVYRQTVKIPFEILETFPIGLDPSCKMLCLTEKASDKLAVLSKKLTDALSDQITCVQSHPRLLEVFSKDAGKGTAVKELCDILGVDIKNSFAAGDEQNDISMIEAAGTGIAMLNGRDVVKEAADVITKTDNNNDGLLPFFV